MALSSCQGSFEERVFIWEHPAEFIPRTMTTDGRRPATQRRVVNESPCAPPRLKTYHHIITANTRQAAVNNKRRYVTHQPHSDTPPLDILILTCQVIGCENRLRHEIDCVYSNSTCNSYNNSTAPMVNTTSSHCRFTIMLQQSSVRIRRTSTS